MKMGAADAEAVIAGGNKADRIPAEAREMLKSLAEGWGDVEDAAALQVVPLKGAMTNQVFQIKWPTVEASAASRKVLVRIYGEGVDALFDRGDEIKTFEFMSKQGQGPRLLRRFSNGRIEEFIHARTLSAADLRDPDTSVLIAAKLREFNCLEMPGTKNVRLWERMRSWLKTAESVCPMEEAESFQLVNIGDEISLLEKELSKDQSVGFCHNDLQYGNIMMDEETKAITIIDYEYASYNPIAYDIANHFCEMVADYHTDTPHIMDYSKYPGLEERKRFVQAYLSSSGEHPSDTEAEQLLEEVEKYTLASHLIWGLWGIISEHVNEIDFDYKEYARQRFEQYWLRKKELLGLEEELSHKMKGTEEESLKKKGSEEESLEKKGFEEESLTKKGSEEESPEKKCSEKGSEEESLEKKGSEEDTPAAPDGEINGEDQADDEASTSKKKTGFFRRMKKFLSLARLTR